MPAGFNCRGEGVRCFHSRAPLPSGCLLVCLTLSPLAPPHHLAATGRPRGLTKHVIACLDVRANDSGNLVVTKGDQYDVRETGPANEVVGWCRRMPTRAGFWRLQQLCTGWVWHGV